MKSLSRVSMIAVFVFAFAGAARAELFVNPSFESPTPDPWDKSVIPDGWARFLSGGYGYYGPIGEFVHENLSEGGADSAYSGLQSVAVGGYGNYPGYGGFYQEFSATPGMEYTVSSWAKLKFGAGGSTFIKLEMYDAAGGRIGANSPEETLDFFPDGNWAQHTHSRTAPANAVMVRGVLGAIGNNYVSYMDDASLVPEPMTVVLLGAGAAAIFLRRRKRC